MKHYFKHKIENVLIIRNIVTIEYLELSKNYVLKNDRHNFWEMVYVDKDSVIYTIDSKPILVNEGEILLLKPNQQHSITVTDANAPRVFIVCFECLSQIMSFFNGYKIKIEQKNDKFFLSQIIEETKQTFMLPFKEKLEINDNPNLGGQQAISNYLELLLISLLRAEAHNEERNANFLKNDEFANQLINIVIEYLRENIYTSIRIDDVCKTVNYSKSYISQAFKMYTKMSVVEYYNNLKISEAKNLIRKQQLTVSDISDKLNFSDPRYFCYLFKKTTGMTPTQYRHSINLSI